MPFSEGLVIIPVLFWLVFFKSLLKAARFPFTIFSITASLSFEFLGGISAKSSLSLF